LKWEGIHERLAGKDLEGGRDVHNSERFSFRFPKTTTISHVQSRNDLRMDKNGSFMFYMEKYFTTQKHANYFYSKRRTKMAGK
jgi:hypothetical protein